MNNSDNSGGLKKKLIFLSLAIGILSFSAVLFSTKQETHANNNGFSKTLQVEEVKNYSMALKKESSRKKVLAERMQVRARRLVDEDVESTLKIKIKGYELNANEKTLGIFKTKEEANKLLEEITKPFTEDEETKIESIEFKEDIKIIETKAKINDFTTYEEALYYITKGTKETRIHKVEKGENYWVIAKKYKIKSSDLEKANPDINPERIQIGQEISLVVPKPFITVMTTETKKYKEEIPFETEHEETSALYRGDYRVKVAGKKGEKEIKAKIIKENGIEVDREILNESILDDPVTKIVLKGTKKPPPKIGTGSLSKPTSRGVITSPFGSRWGRRHTGIDIGMPTGTSVKAADGGKVIYSGWKGGYGKLVIIDHGANMQTYYAHNSKLLVKKGEKVFKGQTVAKSGNTGRSTGPHLHFEVRKNGTPINPIKYVKY